MINAIKNAIKGTLLEPPARWLLTTYRRYIFGRTIKRVLSKPEALLKDRDILAELIRLWGNEPYTAAIDYLIDCLKYTAQSRLPVLECGSGLTTILVGLLAQQYGITVWSLENNHKWRNKINKYLDKYHIESVKLCSSPLVDYGEYSRYDAPLDIMPDRFSLVICDGPPRENKGRRYGLLPVMKQQFVSGCVILLDDAKFDIEQSNVYRWSQEFDVSYEKRGTGRPYFVVSVPAVDEQY